MKTVAARRLAGRCIVLGRKNHVEAGRFIPSTRSAT